MKRIDDLFNSSNNIYHYTKIQTAYEYILHTNKLKLSNRKNAIDPIENISERIIVRSFCGYEYTEKPDDETVSKVSKFIKGKINNSKQLCFCQNDDDPEIRKETILPSRYYGFLKPRMWDQYGDKYNGVCLVFDKTKLKKVNQNIKSDNIKYISYEKLNQIYSNIDLNILHDKGLDKYCEDYEKRIINECFLKHEDYSGENEYRFISLSENENYLNIGNSLMAIVISRNNLSEFAEKWFNDYVTRNNIKLFYIDWDYNGISLQSKKEFDESIESVRELIAQMKKNKASC